MFNSARGQLSSSLDDAQPSSSNYYSTFRFLENTESRKRPVEDNESDKSGSDVEVIQEIWREGKKKRKKEKKEKKRKHKKAKRARRISTVSVDSDKDDIIHVPSTSKVVEDYVDNSLFAQNARKKGIFSRVRIPVSVKYKGGSLDHIYSEEKYDFDKRYFGPKAVKALGKGATEVRFRKKKDVGLEGFTSLSLTAMGSDEEGVEYYPEFNPTMETEEFEAMRKKHSKGYDNLTIEEKRHLIRNEVKQNEHNPEVWDKFLKFEDEQIKVKARNEGIPLRFLRPAHLERKLEILKQAISKVSVQDKVAFLIKQMDTLIELKGPGDASVLQLKKRIQSAHINHLGVWEFVIKQQLNNLNIFNFQKCLKTMDQCIFTLTSLLNRTFVSHNVLPGTEKFLINVIANRCRLLIQAGHVHQAITMVQAILEFNCFVPQTVKSHIRNEKLKAFEDFWHSAVPRIGSDKAQGWSNFNGVFEVDSQENEMYEKGILMEEIRLMYKEEEAFQGSEYIKKFNLPLYWHALEKTRMRFSWKPVATLYDKEDYGFAERYMGFETLKPILLDLPSTFDIETMVFTLLQVIGIVDPILSDNSEQGIMRTILPEVARNDFAKYYNYTEFLQNILKLLSKSSSISKERAVMSMVLTKVRFDNDNNLSPQLKIKNIRELQMSLPKISSTSSHLGTFACLNSIADVLGLDSTAVGLGINTIEDGVKSTEKTFILNGYWSYLEKSPFKFNDGVEKQLVLYAIYNLVVKLASSRSWRCKTYLNRLRLLTFVVLENKFDKYFDDKFELRPDEVKEAATLWDSAFKALPTTKVHQSETTVIPLSNDIIFKLYCMFTFEVSDENPFCNFSINDCVKDSEERTLFKLDFVGELIKDWKCELSYYRDLVLDTVNRFDDNSRVYSHIVQVYQSKKSFVGSNFCEDLIPSKKRVFVMCEIASIYRHFLNAKDQDNDTVAVGYERRLRFIFDKYLSTISDTLVPECELWRLWMHIERECKEFKSADKVYMQAHRCCPYGKMLSWDAAKNCSAPDNLVDNITNFAENVGLQLLVLPGEASAVRESAMKR